MMLLMNLSLEDLSAELEMELGHKLKNTDKQTGTGIPFLSDTEIIEYLMVDDFEDS